MIFLAVFLSVFLIGAVSAADNCLTSLDAKSTADLISKIPSIDASLQACPVAVPSQLKKIFSNGVIFIDITDGEKIAITISGGKITGIKVGQPSTYTQKLSLTTCVLDVILSKENKIGAFAAYYLSGKAQLGAKGFFNRIKLAIAKPFLNFGLKKVQTPVEDTCSDAKKTDAKNKPENCYETYMEGHKEYQYGKANWDKWKAETKGVCQTQINEIKGGKCEYTFQQIEPTTGSTKWLCWYN